MLCGLLSLTPACGAGENKRGNEQMATVRGKDCSRRKNLVTEIEMHGVCKSGQNFHLEKWQKSVFMQNLQGAGQNGKLSCDFIWYNATIE